MDKSTKIMIETDINDWNTSDGKIYYYSGSGSYLLAGLNKYYFAYKDHYAPEGTIYSDYYYIYVNTPPILSNGEVSPSEPYYENTQLNFTVIFTDIDNYPPTLIKWREDNGTTQNVTMLPVDLSDNNYADGKQYYIITTLNRGTHWYDFLGKDNISFDEFADNYITIINRNPVITSTGNITQLENTFLSYQIIASDPDSDTLTYQLSTNASWATITSNYVNGTATGVGWYTFSVWANDSYGGSDIEYWTLNVTSNLPPYFTSTPTYTCENMTYYSYHAIASDPENDILTYDLEGNATFLSINPSSGIVSGTPNLVGIYNVNVSVTDGISIIWQNYTLTITIQEIESTGGVETGTIIMIVIMCNMLILGFVYIIKEK
jgi:hypothetical protein